MEKGLLSIVIPAWNEEDYLPETLAEVKRAVGRLEAGGGRAEIIVVDNNSTDRTSEIAREAGARVLNETGRGIARVRNAGVKDSDGEFLAFIDADSHPTEDAFLRIYEELSAGGTAGGGVYIRPDRWTLAVVIFWMLQPLVRIFFGVSAGLIFATREAFEGAGGFDERFYAAEDLEFVMSLKRWGLARGLAFANLVDISIRTSTRKFRTASVSDFLIFPMYLFDKRSMTDRSRCRFWYGKEHR